MSSLDGVTVRACRSCELSRMLIAPASLPGRGLPETLTIWAEILTKWEDSREKSGSICLHRAVTLLFGGNAVRDCPGHAASRPASGKRVDSKGMRGKAADDRARHDSSTVSARRVATVRSLACRPRAPRIRPTASSIVDPARSANRDSASHVLGRLIGHWCPRQMSLAGLAAPDLPRQSQRLPRPTCSRMVTHINSRRGDLIAVVATEKRAKHVQHF